VLYGSVVGNVEDSSGGALPGATVTLTNKGTGLVQTAVTGATGTFTFTNVQAGSYDVKVSMQGFKEAVRTDVPVTANTVSRVDSRLELGALSESFKQASARYQASVARGLRLGPSTVEM
jgi:hypothetical protein